MKNIEEVWYSIPGYEGVYELSNLDRIKSLKKKVFKRGKYCFDTEERILQGNYTEKGYIRYSFLTPKYKRIEFHVVKAMVFLNHTPCGYERVVDHIDNNPNNNNINNLQVITHRLNATKDRERNSQYTGVCWCNTTKKWRARIQINKKTIHLGHFDKEIDAGEAYKNALNKI